MSILIWNQTAAIIHPSSRTTNIQATTPPLKGHQILLSHPSLIILSPPTCHCPIDDTTSINPIINKRHLKKKKPSPSTPKSNTLIMRSSSSIGSSTIRLGENRTTESRTRQARTVVQGRTPIVQCNSGGGTESISIVD